MAAAGHHTAAWYPGNAWVDWIALDAYPQSAPATTLLDGPDGMNQVAAFAKSHGKPMMLAEWAPNTPNPDTAAPIDLVFRWAQSWPGTVKALVYFDFVSQGKDFTLADHPVAAAQFRADTADRTRYLATMPGS